MTCAERAATEGRSRSAVRQAARARASRAGSSCSPTPPRRCRSTIAPTRWRTCARRSTRSASTAEAKAIAEKQRALLDDAAAKAPTPMAAMTYNWQRAEVYVYLGRPLDIVPALEKSAQAICPASTIRARGSAGSTCKAGKLPEAAKWTDEALQLVYGPRKARLLDPRAEIAHASTTRRASSSSGRRSSSCGRRCRRARRRPRRSPRRRRRSRRSTRPLAPAARTDGNAARAGAVGARMSGMRLRSRGCARVCDGRPRCERREPRRLPRRADVLRRDRLRDRARVGVGASARRPDAGARRRVLRRDARAGVRRCGRACAPRSRSPAARGHRLLIALQAFVDRRVVQALHGRRPWRRSAHAVVVLARRGNARRSAARSPACRRPASSIGSALAVWATRARRAAAAARRAGRASPRRRCPGASTVVEFVDFECPFCRGCRSASTRAIDTPAPVHVVRKMMPLPHASRRAARRARVVLRRRCRARATRWPPRCSLRRPPTLTPARLRAHRRAQPACDMARYRRDIDSPEVAAHVAADLADAPRAPASTRCRHCSSAASA